MINKKYLPSKNFIITVIVAVCVILITIVANYWKPNITNFRNSNLAIDTNASSSKSNIDSDSDGLPDWLENLYGTNPFKADTDGDGTNDADEVNQNRDPLKANTAPKGQEPNDKVPQAVIEQDQKATAEYASLTPTDKMARNLMSNIFASLPATGQQVDQVTSDSIIQKSMQDIPTVQYFGITKESDLNLIKLVDGKVLSKDMLAYINGYYTQTKLFSLIMGKDLDVINKYISASDVTVRLAAITSQYQAIINNLIKMPVPALPDSDGVRFYLALINNLEKLIQIDNDIVSSYNKDTARAFSDLSAYNNTRKELIIILNTIDTVLNIKR